MIVKRFDDGTLAFSDDLNRILVTIWHGGVSIPTTTGIDELHEIIRYLAAANMQFASMLAISKAGANDSSGED